MQWEAFELTARNGRQLYIPPGVAHGFQTLDPATSVGYMMTVFHAPAAATGVRYDDPAFGIHWPLPLAAISERDQAWPDFDPGAMSSLAAPVARRRRAVLDWNPGRRLGAEPSQPENLKNGQQARYRGISGTGVAAWKPCLGFGGRPPEACAMLLLQKTEWELTHESPDHRAPGFHRRGHGAVGAESGARGYRA